MDVAFHFTKTQLTFAVPIGVILGALIALVGVVLTNQANLKRMKAERQWDTRARVYAATVVEINKFTSRMHGAASGEMIQVAGLRDLLVPLVDYMDEHSADMYLFNTKKVETAQKELLAEIAEVQKWLNKLNVVVIPGSEIKPRAESLGNKQHDLVLAIQDDLK